MKILRNNPSLEKKIISFINYLRYDFRSQIIWKSEELELEFTYEEIKHEIDNLALTDPSLYRQLHPLYNSQLSIAAISRDILNCDTSTAKRNWHKAANIIINRLVNKEVILPMQAIDLINEGKIVA